MSGFIAVHLGAGYHADHNRKAYKSVCNKACKIAIDLLKSQSSAVKVIAQTVAYLENSPLTNAGIGSNLTIDGIVECDAAIMDGKTLNFGSVGAIYNVKNPIKIAESVLESQNRGLLSIGRIPPCTLAGKGAVKWAIEHGFHLQNADALVTAMSHKAFRKCKALLDKNNKTLIPANGNNTALDTVGAVCIDMDGNMASAVSSGGLILKHSGRLGQAAIFGAGCWAQNGFDTNKPDIAVTVSGTGEYLIKTSFAKECYEQLSGDSSMALPDIFKNKFVESPHLKNISSKLAGVLSLTHHDEKVIELSWAHNTRTFLFGYMSVSEDKPHCLISEQKHVSGRSIVAGGRSINYRFKT